MPKLRDTPPSTVFGKLTVLGCCYIQKKIYALCLCECGNIKPIFLYSLGRGANTCGCRQNSGAFKLKHRVPPNERKEKTTLARTYRAWAALWERVGAAKKFANVEDGLPSRWTDFANFKADLGMCPEGLVLDRIDCRLPYSADNCRWADKRDMLLNSDSTVYYSNGKTVVPESQLSEFFGYAPATLRQRRIKGELPLGWKILTYDEVVSFRKANP